MLVWEEEDPDLFARLQEKNLARQTISSQPLWKLV
jgi:hypothetical protein